MNSTPGALVTRTLAVPVLILVLMLLALSLWVVQLLQAQARVQHTYEVLAHTNEAQRLLIDQDNGLRAYMLTSDRRFLRPYDQGRQQIGKSLGYLESSTAPGARRYVSEVQKNFRFWSADAEAERILVSRNAEKVILSPSARRRLEMRKQRMDSMRAIFASLYEEEARLLKARQQTADRANNTLLYLGATLSLIAAILLTIFLRRQLLRIDSIYAEKAAESERLRHIAEAIAFEVREQANEMERSVLGALQERDEALRRLEARG